MSTKTLIAASLAAGLGMAAALAILRQPAVPPVVAPAAAPTASLGTAAPPATRGEPQAPPRFFTNKSGLDWRAVESADYRQYVANLRALGCPAATVRDIIVADVNKLFEGRQRALATGTNKFQYWKRERPMVDEAWLEQSRQLAREKRALLKELLGVEVAEKEVAAPSPGDVRRRQMLDFLPEDKQAQVAELQTDFSVKVQSLMAGKARPTREDMEQVRALEAQLRGQLAQALTPNEMEDLELRLSRTANYLRATLGDFEMTEPEFRALIKLQQPFDQQYNRMSHEDPEYVAAQLEVNRQAKALLGDERYTQYMREQNWSTSSLRDVARQYGVQKEIAVQVFDLKQPAQEEATRIRQDAGLGTEQRQQALRTVQEETERAMAQILGAEAARAYVREGSWVKSLAREK
jgi:hypothetical protein